MFGLSKNEKDKSLIRAIRDGNVDAAKKALARGADPNVQWYYRQTPLVTVVGYNSENLAIRMFRALKEKGADLQARESYYQRGLLHQVAGHKGSHVTLAGELIDAGLDVLATDAYGNTPLMLALEKQEWRLAEFLMDKGGAVTMANTGNKTLLTLALEGGARPTLLDRILELPVDANAASEGDGKTALHICVEENNTDALQKLLSRPGIEIDKANSQDKTALAIAVELGRTEAAEILVKAGAALNTVDHTGMTPLTVAARENSQEMADLLVKAGAKIDAAGTDGVTPLTLAAQNGSIRMVMSILAAAKDAKPDLQPALFIAAEKGYGRVLELLIEAGGDVNAVASDGRTPLMKAALADQVEALSILIKAGAKPDLGDSHGMFAYDHAVSGGKAKAKDYLSRFRHETLKTGDALSVAAPVQDYHYVRLNDHSLEVREGDGLTMTFNFWTQQVIFRDTERPAPVTVQNFADMQRQEAIEEAYQKLKDLGGTPPDPQGGSIKKKAGLTAKP